MFVKQIRFRLESNPLFFSVFVLVTPFLERELLWYLGNAKETEHFRTRRTEDGKNYVQEQGEQVMKLHFALTLGLLTAAAGMAQGPMYDKITVNLPYSVTINKTVLPPGDYEIRQDPSPTNNRILRFFTDKGMKFETTAMAIPALDNKTPEETSLKLEKYGSDYYLNKIWVQGKDYGYEFPIPDSVKSREKERSATTVAAKYEPSTTQVQASTTTQSTTPAVDTTEPAPAPVARVDAAPAREPEPVKPFELAQNTPPSPPTAATPAPSSRGAADTTPAMPATSANWLNFVLGGGALSGLGLMLRRARG